VRDLTKTDKLGCSIVLAQALHHAVDPLATDFAQFADANALAEALSLPGRRGNLARKIFTAKGTHFRRGIGFYLLSGVVVDRFHAKMFLGRVESQNESLQRLAALLNIYKGGRGNVANATQGTVNWRYTQGTSPSRAALSVSGSNALLLYVHAAQKQNLTVMQDGVFILLGGWVEIGCA